MAANRRNWMTHMLGLAAVPALGLLGRAAAQSPEPQLVKIVAQRFHYTPAEFRVQAGRPVVLEFTSLDFVHGFNMPDLKLRSDLPPGIVTRLNIAAQKPGVYEFVCDNFCGDKHEEMHGRMVVEVGPA
jgi:cytochrome c oxidase subunit 2